MNNLIKNKLKEIEESEGFKILYACETGSRAWGFPSPDSDYDVRFIYVHDLDWHLSLANKKDSFELPINDELDITGWEFKKCLGLLWKSNAALLERVQSPIVYRADLEFLNKIKALAHDFYSPIATMHHYLSMSKKYYDSCMENENIKLKKYFYAIRTAVAGKWIREEDTMPDIEMTKMLGILDDDMRERIYELIELKATKNEDYIHPKEPLIDKFLAETIMENDKIADSLAAGKGDIDKLDDFYREVVKGQVE